MKQGIRDKRNYIIIGLSLLVLFMTVGFAAFRTNLQINGTAGIASNWCVGFDNTKTNAYEVTKGVASGTTPTGEMTYSGTACSTNYVPEVTLDSNFYQPGDKIEYTLTIANKSSLGAAIKSITVDGNSVTSNQTITDGNIIWKVYMPEVTTLTSDATTTMVVSAEFQNEDDISDLTTSESSSLTVGINVVQDDGNGGMVVTPAGFTGSIYSFASSSLSIGDSVGGTKYVITNGNQFAPAGPYESQSECQTALEGFGSPAGYSCQQEALTLEMFGYTTDAISLNKLYYLKHDVVNDIVTASYVCFQNGNEDICMKGGDGGASFLETKQLFVSKGIYYEFDEHSFNDSQRWATVTDEGYVIYDRGLGNYCKVETTGVSSCYGSGMTRN